MGNFARVALPLAATFAAPYVGAFASGAGLSGASNALSFGQKFAAAAGTVNPWGAAFSAGMSGLSQIGQIQQERQQQAIANARNAAEADRLRRDYERRDKARREKMRQAAATARAQFGASGLSSGQGSAAATVSGLLKRGDDERRDDLANYRAGVNMLAPARSRGSGLSVLQNTISPIVNVLRDK